jgi:hypothetical protein
MQMSVGQTHKLVKGHKLCGGCIRNTLKTPQTKDSPRQRLRLTSNHRISTHKIGSVQLTYDEWYCMGESFLKIYLLWAASLSCNLNVRETGAVPSHWHPQSSRKTRSRNRYRYTMLTNGEISSIPKLIERRKADGDDIPNKKQKQN